MNKLIIIFLTITTLTLGACASDGINEVNPDSTEYLMNYKDGIVTEIKPVVIKDTGTGGFLGAITGAVIGSTMGEGRGSALTTLGGGLLGAYAGNEAGKTNAQELTVELNNGSSVITITKGQKFSTGQHVRIVMENNRVVSVEHN